MTCTISCGDVVSGSNYFTTNHISLESRDRRLTDGKDSIYSLSLTKSTFVSISTCSDLTTLDTIVAVLDSRNQIVAKNDDTQHCPSNTLSSFVSVELGAVSDNSFFNILS